MTTSRFGNSPRSLVGWGTRLRSWVILSGATLVTTLGMLPQSSRAQPILPAQDGTGTIVTPSGQSFDISGGTLSPDQLNLFHSFEQLGLDPQQVANFLAQPQLRNILGRVVGGDPSVIQGIIRVSGGNANLFLMNPAGFVFGPGAQLDVPGNFTATTANGIQLGDEWFNAAGGNNYSNLTGDPSGLGFTMANPGAIVNAGDLILAPGQTLALVGGTVANSGSLSAPGGQVILASMPEPGVVRFSQPGQVLSVEFDLDPQGNLPADWALPMAQLGELIDLSHNYDLGFTLLPDGSVQLSVNPGGSAPVEPTAGTTIVGGSVDVTSTQGTGGTIAALGQGVYLQGAQLSADGSQGGGFVAVGGAYQGQDTLPSAQTTRIDRASRISANATTQGDGGQVIVWADDSTQYQGSISATGGNQGGNGGFVEVSGAQTLQFSGSVDTSAPQGTSGTVLLDPQDIIIQANPPAPDQTSEALDGAINSGDGGTATDFVLSNTSLTSLVSGNLFLQASRDIISLGGADLNFFQQTAGETVTFDAGRNITLNSNLTTAGGAVNLLARSGNITLGGSIKTSGGAISLTANSGTINASGGDASEVRNGGNIGNNFTLNSSTNNNNNGGNISLSAGGDITVGFLSSTSGGSGSGGNISLISSGGNINATASNIPVNLSSASGTVTTGLIVSGSTSGSGGTVTLSAPGNIQVGAIGTGTGSTTGGSGGAVNITSTGGSVNAVSTGTFSGLANLSSLQFGAIATGSDNGNGGAVTINAAGDISTGAMATASLDGAAGAINLNSSNGGINTSYDLVTSNPSTSLWTELINQFGMNGVRVNGRTFDNATAASLLGTGNARVGIMAFSENGTGGNVTLNASGNIVTSNIITGSLYGNGGNISLTSRNGSIDGSAAVLLSNVSSNLVTQLGYSADLGRLVEYFSSSSVQLGGYVTLSLTGNAGNINLNASGNILANYLIASSFSGSGGSIFLNSTNGAIDINRVIFNATNGATANGLIQGNDDTLRRLVNVLSRGNVTSSGATGNSITFQAGDYIKAGTLNSSGTTGNGGNVTIDPPNGTTLAYINAQGGSAGRGGNVSISTGNFLRITDAFFDRNGVYASISTAGGRGGGSISIVLDGTVWGKYPFRIGDPRFNGTLGAITSGDYTIPVGTDIYPTTRIGNIRVATYDDCSTDQSLCPVLPLPPTLNTPPSLLNLDEIRDNLAEIERLTGVKPALIYANFVSNQVPRFRTLEETVAGLDSQLTEELGQQINTSVTAENPPIQLESGDEDTLELVIVTAHQDPIRQVISSATRRRVETVLFSLRADIEDQIPINQLLSKSQQLYRWLVEPLEEILISREISNIAFVMGDDLRLVPLAALHDGEGFIIEKYSVGLMPSMALTETQYASVKDMTLLAMGADTFVDQNPLYAVPSELDIITDIWAAPEPVLNQGFTPENLRQLRSRQGAGIVHLATHGFFNRGELSESYIQFADDRKLGLHELQALRFDDPATELIILSACQTAFGTEDDEVELGFAGLAHQSGAKSALGSLWEVGDTSTLAFMTSFYENLRTAPIKAEALRQAQLAILHGKVNFEDGTIVTPNGRYPLQSITLQNIDQQANLTHPFAWSAFTMIGSPW